MNFTIENVNLKNMRITIVQGTLKMLRLNKDLDGNYCFKYNMRKYQLVNNHDSWTYNLIEK
jgi:hypothetical protein